MYSQIDKNKALTVMLLLGFISFVVVFTLIASYAFTGDLLTGGFFAFIAFILSLASGLFSYFGGASLVLAMTGAQNIIGNPNYKPLLDRIEILCIKAGLPMPQVHILPDQALNAFATGRNPENAHVAITQGLLQAMTPEEVDAVVAHELGHIKNYDIRLMLIVSVLAGVITYIADFFIRGIFYRKSDSDNGGNPIVFIVAIIFAILAPIISTIIQLAISRRREFLADMTSVEITRYPQSMISALRKLQSDDRPVSKATEGNAHMFIDFPLKNAGNFLQKLFSTHPPIEDRIAALEQL